MTPSAFLHAIWPDEGYYCIARPAKEFKGFVHKVFSDIDQSAQFVATHADECDLYFCMHTLKEPKVFNPNKLNRKTGEKGAYEIRVQKNTKECKCFFFDLDVGEKSTNYASQTDALRGLRDFCKTTGLPRPIASSSGGGVHVFWVLDTPLPAEEWRRHAAKLKAIAKHFGLLADPMRTTDSSSVLRIPGTFNFKNDTRRPVEILFTGRSWSTEEFIALLDAIIAQHGIVVSAHENKYANELGDNLSLYADKPPVKMESLVSACAQIRKNIENQATLTEPQWFHTLNLVRFVEDADIQIHKVSEKHPNYSKEETEEKVANQRAKGAGPTLCTTMADFCGGDICHECPYFGRVKSPLVAAAQLEQAAKPVEVLTLVDGNELSITVPPPPYPYERLENGGVGLKSKDKKGNTFTEHLYDHDFYPIRRISGADRQGDSKDHSVWRAILPFEGAKEFSIPSKVIYDKLQLLGFLAEHSVIIPHEKGELIRAYMIAYIAHLQKIESAERQVHTLGWSPDLTQFFLADKVLHKDGSSKPITLSPNASACAQFIEKKGTLEKQIELMQFYNHTEYAPIQFFIAASLASPLLFATGFAGSVLNASGPPGASKSTSLYTAASFWGKPKMYPMNGTANGATTKARFEKMATLANLPICVDELTHIFAKDANTMMMNATQYNPRERLKRTGDYKNTMVSEKSTFMLTTSNNSLHSVLATDNAAATAGSMRLYEILFNKVGVHQKHEADAFMRQLNENYGHIGEEFMKYVVPNIDMIIERIVSNVRRIDIDYKIDPSERFWSAMDGAILTTLEISHDLKLLPFDPSVVEMWALKVQLPVMRKVIVNEYASASPLAVLADFIAKYLDRILVVRKSAMGNSPACMVVKEPRGGIVGHYDLDKKTMWISYTPFNLYCKETNVNITQTLKDLESMRVTKNGRSIGVVMKKDDEIRHKFTIGAGTDYKIPQNWAFAINMEHPEVSGALEIDLKTNVDAILTPPKGDLKVV